MPTQHTISASVQEALEHALITDDIEVIADVFVECYVLAQMGVGKKSYAAGIDEICLAILTRRTGQ